MFWKNLFFVVIYFFSFKLNPYIHLNSLFSKHYYIYITTYNIYIIYWISILIIRYNKFEILFNYFKYKIFELIIFKLNFNIDFLFLIIVIGILQVLFLVM